MKKQLILAVLFSALSLYVNAQTDQYETGHTSATPNWISEKGYWVIESNIHTPTSSVVYFYTNDHVMVYKEKVENLVLNIKKQKVRMRLKKSLEQVIYAYEQKQLLQEKNDWIASNFKK